MESSDAVQILVGFGALVAFLTGFAALRQRQRLEFLRESVRAANERLEDLAERQDALPLPATAVNQELRPTVRDPLNWFVIGLSVTTAALVARSYDRLGTDVTGVEAGVAGQLASLAVILIVVMALLGIVDAWWGRRELVSAVRHYTAHHAAVLMLRNLIIGRLVLVQQLHRALVGRLGASATDPAGADTMTLRLIAALPSLLPGAGVSPWLVRQAERRADRHLTAGRAGALLPPSATAEAIRADLVLRQFRPTAAMWEEIERFAHDLRARLPEWEWIDLISAWTASGILPAHPDPTELTTLAEIAARLERTDYQRSLGIHAESRDTDSRDLAAWTVSDVIDRRRTRLGERAQGSERSWLGCLWDIDIRDDVEGDRRSRTDVNGFQTRDPIVWMALTVPSTADPATWVDRHFVVTTSGIAWRQRAGNKDVAHEVTDLLSRQHSDVADVRAEVDGTLTDRILGHPFTDTSTLDALRAGGARDIAALFRRYERSEAEREHPKRVPLSARVRRELDTLRAFLVLRRRDQVLLVLAGVIVSYFLNRLVN